MQTAQLHTLLAIRAAGSLSRAAARLNLSHSAVSLQIRRLEETLGRDVLIKGRRPAQLTPFGHILCRRADPLLQGLAALSRLAQPDCTSGEITIGFVPTTLQTLLPVVLAGMTARFPDLSVRGVSGLSRDLADQVTDGRLDFAILTAPDTPRPPLDLLTLGHEPLCLVAPRGTGFPTHPLDLLRKMPFVGFSRATWLGARIETLLRENGHAPTPLVELDSIDAVENLVARGFGASILPARLHAADLSTRMECLLLTGPGTSRELVLAARREDDRLTIRHALASFAKAQEHPQKA